MGPDEAGTARHEPSFRLTPHFELNRFVIEVFQEQILVTSGRLAVSRSSELLPTANFILTTNDYA